MNGPGTTEINTSRSRGACLVDGCACKDARIISTRRASYFASIAGSRGETANRIIPADPSWAIPTLASLELGATLAPDQGTAA